MRLALLSKIVVFCAFVCFFGALIPPDSFAAPPTNSNGALVSPQPIVHDGNAQEIPDAKPVEWGGSWMSTKEFALSVIILLFGLFTLVAEVWLASKVPQTFTLPQLLRLFGVTLIIIGAFLMVVAGFSAQAIGPAMGLLGTIAGYLLGQREGRDAPPQNEVENE
jgi:hypothetical protein